MCTDKQVFSDMDLLGWYTTGDTPGPPDLLVHKQICDLLESPIFLKLNPMARHTDVSHTHTHYLSGATHPRITYVYLQGYFISYNADIAYLIAFKV